MLYTELNKKLIKKHTHMHTQIQLSNQKKNGENRSNKSKVMTKFVSCFFYFIIWCIHIFQIKWIEHVKG